MNKAELVEKVAGKVGLTKKDVGSIVDAVIETVSDSLSQGGKVNSGWFWNLSDDAEKGKKRKKSTNGRTDSNTSEAGA